MAKVCFIHIVAEAVAQFVISSYHLLFKFFDETHELVIICNLIYLYIYIWIIQVNLFSISPRSFLCIFVDVEVVTIHQLKVHSSLKFFPTLVLKSVTKSNSLKAFTWIDHYWHRWYVLVAAKNLAQVKQCVDEADAAYRSADDDDDDAHTGEVVSETNRRWLSSNSFIIVGRRMVRVSCGKLMTLLLLFDDNL